MPHDSPGLIIFISFSLCLFQGWMDGNYTFSVRIMWLNGTIVDELVSKAEPNEVLVLYRAATLLQANKDIVDLSIPHDELEVIIRYWDTVSKEWLEPSCPDCAVKSIFNKTDSSVTNFVKSVISPAQYATFFRYPRQSGVFTLPTPSSCLVTRNTGTAAVDLKRNYGAYGDVSVSWTAEPLHSFTGSLQSEGSHSVAQGVWDSTIQLPVPAPTGSLGQIRLRLKSAEPNAFVDDSTTIVNVLKTQAQGGVVEFDQTEMVVSESAGTLSLKIVRACGTRATTVRFSVAFQASLDEAPLSLSSFETGDFRTVSGVVDIASGESSAMLTVDIKDDVVPELNETIVLTLVSADQAHIGVRSAMQITILENDNPYGVLEMVQTNIVVREGFDSFALVDVSRQQGSFGSIIVHYTASSDSVAMGDVKALVGQDYVGGDSMLVMQQGEVSGTIRVSIIDDAIVEQDEMLIVSLTGADGGAVLSASTDTKVTKVTILPKNDNTPTFMDTVMSFTLEEKDIAAPGFSVGITTATDPDLGDRGKISYGLTGGFCNCTWLQINSTSGELIGGQALMPWNTKDFCVCSVTASDSGVPERSSSVMVNINIVFTERCRVGTVSADGRLPCTPCPVPTYQDELGQQTCKMCPDGLSTVMNASSSAALCLGKNTSLVHITDCGIFCTGSKLWCNALTCIP